ncbi:serine protease 48-like [Centruroides sculpturatus]|uniref:serine protease 48-like n=1 Tax=Centruroides sculpturatus TaxID=218467 RepID=UPI000C6E68BF|nr:serine protease 48-like [Centruroides sculpturatus]
MKFHLILICLLSSKEISGIEVNFPEETKRCHEKLGEKGICIEFGKCSIAKELIKQRKIPVPCGFSGIVPLVCCAISSLPGQLVRESECGIKHLEEEERNSGISFPSTESSEYGDSIIQPRKLNRTLENKHEFQQGNFPWIVSVIRKNDSAVICLGFLIDEFRIITAAHCYSEASTAEHYSMYILKNGSRKWYEIDEVRIYEEFNGYYDDIAILKSSSAISEIPICLPKTINEINLIGRAAVFIGWLNGDDDDVKMVSEEMQIADVEVCEKDYSKFIVSPFPSGIKEESICTYSLYPDTDTCKNNSGGLLMLEDGGRWFVVGIQTFAAPCDLQNIPIVYTNVSHYLNWIQ